MRGQIEASCTNRVDLYVPSWTLTAEYPPENEIRFCDDRSETTPRRHRGRNGIGIGRQLNGTFARDEVRAYNMRTI